MTIPTFLRPLGLALLFSFVVAPLAAANRTLSIAAPATAKAGTKVEVTVTASTDAADSEHVGFLHAEFSVDGGKTWVPVYRENAGREARQGFDFRTGAAGTPVLVRARAAFRGGKAGDVDHQGQPVDWAGAWENWAEPSARHHTIAVTP